MLRAKIEELNADSIYRTLCDRLEAEQTAILAGAGDEDNWYQVFEQARAREKEILGV